MKTMMINFNMMVLTMTAAFTLSFSTITLANNVSKDGNATELQFVGKVESLPVFRLVINSDVNTEYVVTVREGNGDLLFSEKIAGSNISRMYKLDSENLDLISGTSFEVTNKTTNKTTVYKIRNVRTTVDNVEIAKL